MTVLGVAACKSSSSSPSSSGSSGSGGGSTASASGKTVTVATDLPLQGTNKDANDSTNKMIQLYLDEHGDKAGNYNIKLKVYDNSIASTGAWDPSTCTKNAQAHIANASEIAVMGTFNSGCAKLEVPILNGGPLLMVSDANTSPGLTKSYAGNDPGEPDKYYPSGKRNYARVVTTDDYQGTAAALFAKQDLKVTNCYVINDNSTYGTGIAKSFATNATKDGIKVLGNESWDPKASNYTALMTKIKALGAQCIYLGGTYDQNGGQLVKDKFNVLGDNTKVKMFAPDGFTGYPALDKQPQSQGMYLTFAGLATEQLLKQAGAGAKLLAAYKAKYGSAPTGSYPLYGAAAMQVIMAAIAKSDGTRQSVVDQVFGSTPITIPASESVLGKELVIDPKTGDVNAKDISVLVMKNNQETFLQPESVK
ncbi:branched-chain amino acid ABC transporter substrate-binding protein [uncultured Jatrophihabitans sp.]|uniref:branched-chain amino acid ABC transporter substrate-binding protein n=1 Tax=uncultured Jatrophihabitans sp. TaxID=1610747 RepID=UPI0035CC4D37